jgi:hypothetical protein
MKGGGVLVFLLVFSMEATTKDSPLAAVVISVASASVLMVSLSIFSP